MNNDMAGELNNHIELQKNNGADNSIQKQSAQKSDSSFLKNTNASDSIRKSTQEFIKNPEFVQTYVDFCDSLVEEGCILREAIDKTDKIFKVLKDKNLYN